MSVSNLFQQKLEVVNIGLEQFRDDLSAQNVGVTHLQWRIPTPKTKE